MLLALLLRVAEACAELNSLDTHAAAECGAIGTDDVLAHEFKLQFVLFLLAPLDEFALVIVILLGHLVEVDVLANETFLKETIAVGIATIEINGSHKCLEGIAGDETVVCMIDMGGLYEFDQTYLLGYTIEAAALHYLAACGCEKSLSLTIEVMIEYIAHDGFDDGISQILETLVVFLIFVRTVVIERTVHQCLPIDVDIMRVKAEHLVQLTRKKLVAATQIIEIVGK
jgi:hypothetical protein